MITKNEVINKFIFSKLSPKIRQKIEVLLLNKAFNKDVDILRKKWERLIVEYKKSDVEINKLVKKYRFKIEEIPPKEKNKIGFWLNEQVKLMGSEELQGDTITLIKKHKLFPVSYWLNPMLFYVVADSRTFTCLQAGLTLDDLGKDIVDKIPLDINFDIKIKRNKETQELELFLQLFEDTVLADIKKHWKVIGYCQKKLKNLKGIKKRYYPLGKLLIAQKLKEIDKKKKEGYYDPDLKKQVKRKITDIDKALAIYGNIPFAEKEERKASNRLKQIRYQYRKRVGS